MRRKGEVRDERGKVQQEAPGPMVLVLVNEKLKKKNTSERECVFISAIIKT